MYGKRGSKNGMGNGVKGKGKGKGKGMHPGPRCAGTPKAGRSLSSKGTSTKGFQSKYANKGIGQRG